MGPDCVTFDKGFRAHLGAESADVGSRGLAAAPFFVFGGIESVERWWVTVRTKVDFGGV